MGRYSPTVLPYVGDDPIETLSRALGAGIAYQDEDEERRRRRRLEEEALELRRESEESDRAFRASEAERNEKFRQDESALDERFRRDALRDEQETNLAKLTADPNLRDVTGTRDPSEDIAAAFAASRMAMGDAPSGARVPRVQDRVGYAGRQFAVDPNWRQRREARAALDPAITANAIDPEMRPVYEQLPEMLIEELRPRYMSIEDRLALQEQRATQRLKEIAASGGEQRKTRAMPPGRPLSSTNRERAADDAKRVAAADKADELREQALTQEINAIRANRPDATSRRRMRPGSPEFSRDSASVARADSLEGERSKLMRARAARQDSLARNLEPQEPEGRRGKDLSESEAREVGQHLQRQGYTKAEALRLMRTAGDSVLAAARRSARRR